MKLLFDENLAARLARDLADLYPGSAHLEDLGLLGAEDRVIWSRAGDGGFILVTKDQDFHRFSVLVGPPPKVVWIRLGNCRTDEVARLLTAEAQRLRAFAADVDSAFLLLG